MKSKPFFSIIIPVRTETDYLRQTVKKLNRQSFKSYELIVITDKISGTANPAQKRNLGAKMSQGKYLAFLDDDSYPHPDWLKNVHQQILLQPTISAFCGPCLTPPDDDIYRQASGLVWSSYLGSGGAGTYRNQVSTPRYVDDFPSVNLIVKRSDFIKIHGFNTNHWPGEDTILCLDIVTKLHNQIYYHPSVIVYHHRRQVIIPHLQQITRYALHRGNFARIYPQTSLRLGYLLPSIFFIYCLLFPFLVSSFQFLIYPLYLYFLLLLITFINFLITSYSLLVSVFAVITIPLTHLYYGVLFIVGYCTPNLAFKPHQLKDQNYHGG